MIWPLRVSVPSTRPMSFLFDLEWLTSDWAWNSIAGVSACPYSCRRCTRDRSGVLAGQAEWQTRLLAAAATQDGRRDAHCKHTVARAGRTLRIGTRPKA